MKMQTRIQLALVAFFLAGASVGVLSRVIEFWMLFFLSMMAWWLAAAGAMLLRMQFDHESRS